MLRTPRTPRAGRSHHSRGLAVPWPRAGRAAAPACVPAGGSPAGTWTPTLPPSSLEGAESSSQELGEAAVLARSSEGSHPTSDTKLSAIRWAGKGFPDLAAGGGGDQRGGPPKQCCVTLF